jgi:exoribonuclease II
MSEQTKKNHLKNKNLTEAATINKESSSDFLKEKERWLQEAKRIAEQLDESKQVQSNLNRSRDTLAFDSGNSRH